MTPSTPLGSFHQSPFWRLRARFRDYGLFDSELAQATGIAPVNSQPPDAGHDALDIRRDQDHLPGAEHPAGAVGAYFFPDIEKEESQ